MILIMLLCSSKFYCFSKFYFSFLVILLCSEIFYRILDDFYKYAPASAPFHRKGQFDSLLLAHNCHIVDYCLGSILFMVN